MPAAMTLAKILHDCRRFIDDMAIVIDDRRLAQRMNVKQFGRRKVGNGIPLMMHDVVIDPEFLKQPQYAL